MKCCEYSPGTIITTLNFYRNLQTVSIRYTVCPWQAFPAKCNVKLQIIGSFLSYEENEVL
jgi:hypothetical protein